jgi:hypothetical protein
MHMHIVSLVSPLLRQLESAKYDSHGYRYELHRTPVCCLMIAEPVVEAVNTSGRELSTEGGSTILIQGRNFGPAGLEKGQVVKVGEKFYLNE